MPTVIDSHFTVDDIGIPNRRKEYNSIVGAYYLLR